MNKWSDSLCRTSISKHLIEDLKKEYQDKIPPPYLASISIDIKNKSDFKELDEAVKYLKNHISEALYQAIIEEQREIKSDLKWIGTKRGQYVAEINDWQQKFHSEFRSMEEFEDVMIGGHSERMVIFLTGKVKGKDTFVRLLDYVTSKNPPHKLFTQIEIIE